MTDHIQSIDPGAGYGQVASVEQRNKVLRNTYWLLALSLLPTVLGAWLGVASGITKSLTGGMGLIVFLGGAFAFIYAIEKTKNSAAGVPVLLGFTFFMGLMLSAKGRHDQIRPVLEAQHHGDQTRQHQAHEEGKTQ